jgi:SAM-dependent methyltransferase/MFS family permease
MIYAATIFLSSFLLFLVQPLIARLILPWFGGSAAVWTTCMLFFQALLLAGYAYAHFLTKKVHGGRRQALVHTVLLACAVALLPIAPGESWKPAGDAEPISRILILLAATVGLPYFLLASTSPLIQAWFARARPSENPYRLFALSNLASLIALLGYPFAVEPQLTGNQQVAMWSWLFALFALLCAAVAWMTPAPAPQEAQAAASSRLSGKDVAYWLALSATGSVLLLAVTNHLTQNVAAVPLLWLLPLTLYLASFIIAFEGKGWYRPEWFWSFVLMWLAGMAWLLVDADYHYDLPVQLVVFMPGLLLGCLFCHGELYRMRPGTQHLTAFYLIVSAGGALGGLLVAVVAPLVFSGYYELGVGLVVLAVLTALRFMNVNMVARGASLALVLAVAAAAVYDVRRDQRDVSLASRSFYGVLRVKEYGTAGEDGHLRRLIHGTIMHGEQYLHPDKRSRLTTYYAEKSGIGVAIESKHDKPVKVGVIGLGTGTLAAYGRPGDVFRFYDIDPRVIGLAQSQFTYLGDSKAKVELAIGDARLTLEREAPQNFDVLAVDAFSSDAIPVHLITREALGIYLKHVKPDGIVAFHVSNRFLDLVPVVARLAREHGVQVTHIKDDPDDDDPLGRSRSDWVLVSRSAEALKAPKIAEGGAAEPKDKPDWRTWTDDYSNLIQILK